MKQFDLHSKLDGFEDYVERFKIRTMTKEIIKDDKRVAYFFTYIWKEAYSFLKSLTFLEKPSSLSYATLKELLLDYVKGKFHKMIHQDIKKLTTLLHHFNPMRTQGHENSNPLWSCKAGHEDEHRFGKCLPTGEFHLWNSCAFRHAKFWKSRKLDTYG